MNPLFVAIFAAAALSVADATFILTTAATATTGVVTVSTGAAALGLLGGVALLKGLLFGALASRSKKMTKSKGKRSAEDQSEDAAFAVLANAEPAQCYRRLICDMAAGAIPDQDKILSLFTNEVSPVSPKFEFATAAKVGKLINNANLCEVRYSCPLSTEEIAKLFN